MKNLVKTIPCLTCNTKIRTIICHIQLRIDHTGLIKEQQPRIIIAVLVTVAGHTHEGVALNSAVSAMYSRLGTSDCYLRLLCSVQRSYQRWLYKRIYKKEMKFWAVLGSQGCKEKNLPTAISMQLFGVVFSTFLWAKKNFKIFLNIFQHPH